LDETGMAIRAATALKREDLSHFPDFLEKAETGSIGRALGMLGFGTQFAPEFDELEGRHEPRVVDTPRPSTEDSRPESTRVERTPERSAEPATPETTRSSLVVAGLKPASSLGPPTNKRKPVQNVEHESTPTRTTGKAELDIDDGLDEYDHGAIPDEDLFSETKVRRLMAIGGKLFNLKGEQLETRLLEAASKIIGRAVADLHALHWRDGNKVMQALEDQAVKRGVWDAKGN
jgi:hypothetical protein